MTTMTPQSTPAIPAIQAIPAYGGDQGITAIRVLRAEWVKFRSLPSTAWSLLAAVALTIGLGAGYSMLRVTRPPQAAALFDPTAVSLTGVQLAQLAIGILGVLLITGEFGTGLIRTSLTAVPGRLPVLWGKAVTVALVSLVALVPATIAAFVIGQSILSAEHLDTSLGSPGVARAVLGSALYLAVVGLLGLGLGALTRTTAGGIAALFGVLFALQLLAGLLPENLSDHVHRYLPTPAGAAITTVRPGVDSLGPWTGFGLFCLYTAVVLALAGWRLRRRDV